MPLVCETLIIQLLRYMYITEETEIICSFELTFLIHFLPSKELAKRLILLQSYKNSQLGTFAKDTESTTYTMLHGSGKATQEYRIGKS